MGPASLIFVLWEQIGNPDLKIARRDFSPLFCLRNQNFFDSSLNPIGVDVMLWGWGGPGGAGKVAADGDFGRMPTPPPGVHLYKRTPRGGTSPGNRKPELVRIYVSVSSNSRRRT